MRKRPRAVAVGPGIMAFHSFCGVLDAMHDTGADSLVRDVSGSSAGALAGLCYCLRKISSFPAESLADADLATALKPSLSCLLRNFGLVPAEQWESFVGGVMESAGFSDSMTFKELEERSGVRLHVSCFDLNTRRPRYYSPVTDPNVRVVSAVCASTSIPLLFQPRCDLMKGEMLCDAAVLERLPLSPFYAFMDEVVSIELLRDADARPAATRRTLISYIWEIVQVLSPIREIDIEQRLFAQVVVDPGENVANFYMDRAQKIALYDDGYSLGLKSFGGTYTRTPMQAMKISSKTDNSESNIVPRKDAGKFFSSGSGGGDGDSGSVGENGAPK